MADYNSAYTGEEIDAAVGNSKTAADLKTAYESNADTNAFTDAEKSKLTGIASGAEVNPTASAIKTSYESNANTNAFTDAEQTKLSGITAGAEVNAVDSVFGRTGSVTAQSGDYTKSDVGLANVDNTSDADKPISTAMQTALDAKQGDITLTTTGTSGAATLVGDTLNIPNYAGGGGGGTVTEVTTNAPLSVTNGTTTPDLSISQATTLSDGYLSSTDWNTFNSKLSSGDNVSELTNDAGYLTSAPVDSVAGKTGVVTLVKADITDFSDADYATASQGALADSALQNLVEDETPQLGAALDTQGNSITGNYSTDGHRVSIIESTTSRILALTDSGDRILFQNAAASTCTIPTNASVAFPNDTEIDLVDMTDGLLTIVADAGVTLNGVSAGSTSTTAKYAGATLIKIGTDSWLVFGKINDVV